MVSGLTKLDLTNNKMCRFLHLNKNLYQCSEDNFLQRKAQPYSDTSPNDKWSLNRHSIAIHKLNFFILFVLKYDLLSQKCVWGYYTFVTDNIIKMFCLDSRHQRSDNFSISSRFIKLKTDYLKLKTVNTVSWTEPKRRRSTEDRPPMPGEQSLSETFTRWLGNPSKQKGKTCLLKVRCI